MIKELTVHGFKTLVDTTIRFEPLTILVGKNGAGKTALLESFQIVGNFARGGVDRAFGPPPWSLGWLRTRGSGAVTGVSFRVVIELANGNEYIYSLALDERASKAEVLEERLVSKDGRVLADLSKRPSSGGTILKPDSGSANEEEIREIAEVLGSIISYELNPEAIEQGVDPEHTYVGRDGYGVAGFLANLQDKSPDVFERLTVRLRRIRPETQAVDIWSSGAKVYWGLRDPGQDKAFPAIHLSWGDRQLVGLLCLLYSDRKPGSAIAVEEIDRGFHHSRHFEVLELLSEAAYDGLDGQEPIQIIVTTHSPSFINKLQSRIGEIRSVIRFPDGGTLVRPLDELLQERLGTTELATPIGEVWETGLLEELTMTTG
ncbi:MAG TPA: AAA family ATPase [Thermoanaerobaculia bacterium]|jgi:hypothetical protein